MNDLLLHLAGVRQRIHEQSLLTWPSRTSDEATISSAMNEISKLRYEVSIQGQQLRQITKTRGGR